MTDHPSANPVCPLCREPVPADAPSGACPRCLLAAGIPTGGRVADPAGAGAADVAARFPDYEILGFLGRGGMGVVWKARHRGLDRVVALKVLPHDVARTPGFADRFQREARALARLTHPNIVGVHEYGEREGTYFLVMEYVEGVNMRHALREGRIGPRDALRIVPPICDALQYAHDHGVVHRDIKPENVLIAADGRVKVADFGLAKIVGGDSAADLTLTGQVMGTPAYMAPEQVERPASVDHRADIYSLGVVFYEMLTGELPLGRFDAPSKRVQVDVRFDEVVLRSLEKAPERRWQHAAEVRTEVDGIAAGPAAVAPSARGAEARGALNLHFETTPDPPGARRSRMARIGFWMTPAALVAALAGAAAARLLGVGFPAWAAFAVVVAAPAAGCVLSLFAWIRVRGSNRTLGGESWAAAGTLVPPALVCIAAPLVFVLSRADGPVPPAGPSRATGPAESPGPAAAPRGVRFLAPNGAELGPLFVGADERIWLESLWNTAVRTLGTHGDAVPRGLYHPTDEHTLEKMSAEERRARGAAGELGFPLLDPARLGAPVTSFRLDSVVTDAGGLSATMVVTDGRVKVRIPLVRFRTGPATDRQVSYLYFAAGKVAIE